MIDWESLLAGFQDQSSCVNLRPTKDVFILIHCDKLIMDPGLHEVFTLRNVPCPEGIEEHPAPVVVGNRAGPGGGVARFFARFQAEEEIDPLYL